MAENNTNLKNKVISGLIWKFAERMSAQIVSLVVSIVLARLLMPEDYGAVSLVMIFITIANVFVTNGFGVALIQKKDADNIDFSTVFYFSIVFSIVLYVLMFLLAPFVAKFYELPILVPVLRVLSLRIPVAAVNSVQQAYVSRQMAFKRFFYATLIGTVISAFVGIIMAYFGLGVWALVAQYMVNTITDTVVLFFTVKWRPELTFSFKRLKGLFNYGWKLLVQSLLVTLYANLRSLVIGKVYSTTDLAYYNKGSQYPNLIVTNVDTAINSALFPAMSKEQQSLDRVKAIAKRATKLCSYIMCPILIGFAACADSFVIALLTEKWLPIVPYLRIICLNLLFRPAQTATLQAIKSTGRSDAVLKMDIPVRLFGIATLLIAIRYGVFYIALTELMVGIFGMLLYGIVCSRIVGYKLSELLADFGGNIIQSLLMGVVVLGVQYLLPGVPALLTMALQIIIGGITYVLLSILLKNDNFSYLLNELKTFKKKKTR